MNRKPFPCVHHHMEVSGAELSDEALIACVANADPCAMVILVHRFQSRAYGLALSLVSDKGLAEEVTQDAFLRAWHRATTYDSRRGRVSTWLLTITRNLAIDALRARRDHPVDPVIVAALAEGQPEPDPQLDVRLRTELGNLPPDQARPIVLAACYGFTAREIADREGVPVGTAKTRIRRGLARLRTALSVSEPELTPRRARIPSPRTSPDH